MQTRGRELRRTDSATRQWPLILMPPSRWLLAGAQLRRACSRFQALANAVLLCGVECLLGAPTNSLAVLDERQPPNA
jgi:hypothetical protein